MTVAAEGEIVRLTGFCGVEEAEPLLVALLDGATSVDVSGATHLHSAIVQILIAARPTITGAPSDTFLRDFVVPLIQDRET